MDIDDAGRRNLKFDLPDARPAPPIDAIRTVVLGRRNPQTNFHCRVQLSLRPVILVLTSLIG